MLKLLFALLILCLLPLQAQAACTPGSTLTEAVRQQQVSSEIRAKTADGWTLLSQVKVKNLVTLRFTCLAPPPAPLVIECPPNLSVPSADGNPVPVTYSVSASGGVQPYVGPTLTPASGSLFPVNTNSVIAKVVDQANTDVSCGFSVTVTYTPIPPPSTGAGLLVPGDFTCLGAFRTLEMSTGQFTTIEPAAMRLVSGERRWITYDGTGRVREQREPTTLSPCNVDPAQAVQATLVQDWGLFPPVSAGNGGVPGQNSAYVMGLSVDSQRNWLMPFWTITYSGLPTLGANAFAAARFDDATKTLVRVGCWGVANTAQTLVAGGVTSVPAALAARLPGTWKLIGLGGGSGSVGLGLSLGPYLQVVSEPMPNACQSGVDYPLLAGPVLSYFPPNANGPTLVNVNTISGTTIGQTPTVPPTTPSPAWTAFSGYSTNKYPVDWDPWTENGVKHGWFTTDNHVALTHYDDGVKRGVVLVTQSSSGWMNTTVLASPAPTIDRSTYFPTITFSVSDCSTHDGHTCQPGDLMYVQTCTVGVDAGCDSEVNGRNTSFVVIDQVTGGSIRGHVTNPDFANRSLPVVGGRVTFGSLYLHGAPVPSRMTAPFAQIYDPAQLVEVLDHTRQPHEVRYSSEFDLSDLISGFGCPGCAVPGMRSLDDTGGPTRYGAQAVFADESRHQIAVVMTHGWRSIGVVAHTIYILEVRH